MHYRFPLLTALALTLAAPAFAGEAKTSPTGKPGKEHCEHWKNASPEERAAMKARHEKMKERWENASPEERKKMKERHKHWEQATPEERATMKARHEKMKERWENATPEEREKMKARHEEMRKRWENATPEERESFKARKRLEEGRSPGFTQPDLTPTPTDGGITDLPRRSRAK